MINQGENCLLKIMETIQLLKLSKEELEKVECYLADEGDALHLQELSFQDLELADAKTVKSFQELNSFLKKRSLQEEIRKVEQILFAIGQSTSGALYAEETMRWMGRFSKKGQEPEKYELAPAQVAAVYAQYEGNEWNGYVGAVNYSLQNLVLEDAQYLQEALNFCKGQNQNGKLLLLESYFLMQYPEGATQKLSREDAKLLALYEELVIEGLGQVFVHAQGAKGKQLDTALVQRLQEAVKQDALTEELLKQVEGATIRRECKTFFFRGAYVNYMLSHKLQNVVCLLAAVNYEEAMEDLLFANERKIMEKEAGDYDTIFKIPAGKLIAWAAHKGSDNYKNPHRPEIRDVEAKSILRTQLVKNPELYVAHEKKATFDDSLCLRGILQEVNPKLYKEIVENGQENQKEKIIQDMVSDFHQKKEAMAYLRGETEVDSLFTVQDSLREDGKYGGADEWLMLNIFSQNYKDEEFVNRCMVLMAVSGTGWFFGEAIYGEDYTFDKKKSRDIFLRLKEGQLDIAHQLYAYVAIDAQFKEDKKKMLEEAVKPIFLIYLKTRPRETMAAFAEAEKFGRYFALVVMGEDADTYKAEILGYAQDTTKAIREVLIEILKKQTGWRKEIYELLASKKGPDRELAVQVMLHWDTAEDMEVLGKLLETEKNAKVRSLLEGCPQLVAKKEQSFAGAQIQEEKLSTEVPERKGKEKSPEKAQVETKKKQCTETQEEKVKNLLKGGKSRTLAWAYETPFSEVHKSNGEPAGEDYLQAILLCYANMSAPGVNPDASLLAESLKEAELAVYVEELFHKWLEAGADTKKRWVMYAASIHGGRNMMKKLYQQIQDWAKNSRGAIAASAVQALAMNPSSEALVLVDTLAHKSKSKQVKAGAEKTLKEMADKLRLTKEEFIDKIVPDFGFDERSTRIFDYGDRSFTVTITPALELEVVDESGKKMKSLPTPGKKDDAEMAKAASEEFKEIKKQLKTVVTNQKLRLDIALSSERTWSVPVWRDLFIKNPIMHQFSIGLIWGIYEERKLVKSFRYMGDGTFSTEAEEEYTLPGQGRIGLVHPIELSEESRGTWKQRLEDYEITQPIEQLGRAFFYRTEEEEGAKILERFGGLLIENLTLNSKMQQLYWNKGPIQDNGQIYLYYKEDSDIGLGVELQFSGSYAWGLQSDEVILYDVRFYKPGTVDRGAHSEDEADAERQIPLKEIPQRYFSEIVLQLSKVTAACTDRNKDWKRR